ncbi:MAG: winged helix-turn-helix transcriptional regulator [Clostridia bacterium]|nr:winged helix-turn-helix transcriptional regulator [Clostridia bacterium]
MKEELECEQTIIHEDVIKKVSKKIKDEDELVDLAEFFKIFADSTRIRIINALIHSDMCVCDIAYLLNMTHSAISHQLKILKQAKIVKYEKIGKVVYYSLDDDHIERIFHMGVNHIEERK